MPTSGFNILFLILNLDPVSLPALENVKVFADVISNTTPSFSTPSDWMITGLSPILKLFSAKVVIEYVKLDSSLNDKLFTLYLGLTLINQLLSKTLDAFMPRVLIWILSICAVSRFADPVFEKFKSWQA